MIEYLVIFSITVITGILLVFSKNYRVLVGIWVLSLIGLAGFRYHTGWDHEVYEFFFEAIAQAEFGRLFDASQAHSRVGFETGFIFIGWLIAHFTDNYQLILAAITISASLFAVWRIDKTALPVFVVIYLWYGYFHNFGILRQGLAASLLFIAFTTEITTSVILYLLAASIHASSALIGVVLVVLFKRVDKKMVIITLILSWFLSVISGFGLDLKVLLIGDHFQRWVALLDVAELGSKVGVSFILAEYTILAGLICFVKIDDKKTKFAASVLTYRMLSYGIFNETTIAWERTNAFTDPMYALAVAITLTKTVAGTAESLRTVRNRLLVCVVVVSAFVLIKYNRMINSDSRIENQLSHRDRFIPYKSILY